MVVTDCEKVVRLDSLATRVGVPRLRFASEENLEKMLGVGRGSVTMMGLVNDNEHQVSLWIDHQIWVGDHFLTHPLVNTSTLVMPKAEIERFFTLTGHVPHFFGEN